MCNFSFIASNASKTLSVAFCCGVNVSLVVNPTKAFVAHFSLREQQDVSIVIVNKRGIASCFAPLLF